MPARRNRARPGMGACSADGMDVRAVDRASGVGRAPAGCRAAAGRGAPLPRPVGGGSRGGYSQSRARPGRDGRPHAAAPDARRVAARDTCRRHPCACAGAFRWMGPRANGRVGTRGRSEVVEPRCADGGNRRRGALPAGRVHGQGARMERAGDLASVGGRVAARDTARQALYARPRPVAGSRLHLRSAEPAAARTD